MHAIRTNRHNTSLFILKRTLLVRCTFEEMPRDFSIASLFKSLVCLNFILHLCKRCFLGDNAIPFQWGCKLNKVYTEVVCKQTTNGWINNNFTDFTSILNEILMLRENLKATIPNPPNGNGFLSFENQLSMLMVWPSTRITNLVSINTNQLALIFMYTPKWHTDLPANGECCLISEL